MPMVTAMLVAAGQSRRMAGLGDKVLLPLCGRPLILHTLRPFCESPLIDAIVVVTSAALQAELERLLDQPGYRKVSAIVQGGATRQESVRQGLCALPDDTALVAIHDGARPCLDDGTLREVVLKATAGGAAIAAVPVTDTIKLVRRGLAVDTPDRSQLWAAQTPQVFRCDWLQEAYAQAERRGLSATDDSALLTAMGRHVQVVPGSPENIKVTTPVDLLLAEQILSRRNA